MVKCPFCQFDNEDGALFCEQCKSDLGGEPVVIATPAPAVPLAEPFLPVAAFDEETIPLADIPVASAPAADFVEDATITESVPTRESQVAVPAADMKPPLGMPPIQAAPGVAAPKTPAFPPAPAVAPADADAGVSEVHPTMPAASSGSAPAPTTASGVVGQLPAGAQPKLVVMRGQKMSMEYPLYEGHNFIGRADEKPVDIDLEDQEPPDRIWSSRQHALITFEDGILLIEDLNSSNGTFVNRTRVYPGQRRPLQVNDVIQIGTVQLKVRV